MPPLAVTVDSVTVRYRVPKQRVPTLKEWVIRRLRSGLAYEELLALRRVSLQVAPGDTLGVVGANGAGKSTLLRVVAGIVTPTEGEAIVRGRIAPIIELGIGFDSELSGRENVYFNGALLGWSRAEMRTRFDAIVAFAELEDFIDAPLRTYSTGMVARLSFAVATSVETDVLLLDEVLSVGDEAFRRKCEARLEDYCRSGVAIMFVSHSLDAVQRLCRDAVWLHEGEVAMHGPAAEVVARYRAFAEGGPAMRVKIGGRL